MRIVLRADSGFTRDDLMAWCERNRVDYVLGLARNSRLLEELVIDFAWAEDEHQRTGKPARRFKDFRYRTRNSWSRRRRVIGKAEHLAKGANPRFVVTSLAPHDLDAKTLYEKLYCARVTISVRRIKIAFASACPYQAAFALAHARLRAPPQRP